MVSPEPSEVIPLAKPEITESDVSAVCEVLRSGRLVQGPKVKEFERRIAELTDGGEVVAVCNGTAALHLALLSIGIGRGHCVGVPTYSWPATANAVVVTGAKPVFIDIEPGTMGMDPGALGRTLKKQPPLDALLPVHAFGQMARIAEIMAIADEHGIPVIEDAACALGAGLSGAAAGSWGKIGCFSFHPRKAATTGEGGAIRTTDVEAARKMRAMRNHGLDPNSTDPDFIGAGFNLRLTEFQAALGISQLARYADLVNVRRVRARRYHELLAGLPLTCPAVVEIDSHIFQSYVVRLDASVRTRRRRILSTLRAEGVEANIGTYHLPLTTYYRREFGFKAGDFPVTDEVAESAIALPLHAYLTDDDQNVVTDALARAIVS